MSQKRLAKTLTNLGVGVATGSVINDEIGGGFVGTVAGIAGGSLIAPVATEMLEEMGVVDIVEDVLGIFD